ncbi:NADPH-dependent 7-cyano-7-deazaguanine reductase QueF [Psychrobacter sanguinis]|uniref:NADPH-dependent 7-cyano-7-deazaguanine reductase QueF n=1 Tax=Psychrobacter sanguinis TaxID=861445 RepID=UPI00020C7615|nr:NADPH-dependent 7-cyano-7-deazaguanine reductase QueF [Psychrobacter sanguinis]EGK14732.1 queuine synthase [Psychrobacter sp. 1501(2011)]MCD9150933.1 NADPH-dependent 7-cyano-7-deazaguanine reductase QueF [Psychrobacter sanguinis]
MSIHGVLGESTSYPKTYQPDTLYAIPRSMGRNEINWQQDKLAVGVDWWHAFEVSWLNNQGISQMAIARFSIPASSPNIVESKSLKLYLNSLNFTEFDNWVAVQQTIAKDLSACVGAEVGVALFELDAISSGSESDTGFLIAHPQGKCIDNALDGLAHKVSLVEHPDASLLSSTDLLSTDHEDTASGTEKLGTEKEYQLYSNLLRSNCPVTNQPDWGTLSIEISTSHAIDEAKLLSYILSFRQHNGFHEQCVEQIFADLSQRYSPSKLMVRAWYTRRGGIDINPCRVSDISLMPKPSRLVRQ